MLRFSQKPELYRTKRAQRGFQKSHKARWSQEEECGKKMASRLTHLFSPWPAQGRWNWSPGTHREKAMSKYFQPHPNMVGLKLEKEQPKQAVLLKVTPPQRNDCE